MLETVTIVVNFVFLVASVWLGVYVVTRSLRNPVAWLTSLTLWSLSGIFLNILLAIHPPPLPEVISWWMRPFILFWPAGADLRGSSGWLQGWLVVPALAFWHHATVLMLPGYLNFWRRVRILVAYSFAIIAILVHLNTNLIFESVHGDPLYLDSMKPGPLFPFFLGLLLLFILLSLIDLNRSARAAQPGVVKKQFKNLIIATAIAGLTALFVIVSTESRVKVPMFVLSLLLGVDVCLFGYGVARYSSVMEGRTIRRDFIYNLVAAALISCLYLGATRISSVLYNIPVPSVGYVIVVLLAVISHSIIDIARRNLDAVFYQRDKSQLRANLRKLANQVGEFSLEENLIVALESLCSLVRASYGLIVLFDDDGTQVITKYHWKHENVQPEQSLLRADDVMHIEPNQLPSPLADAALLVPLYENSEQCGALILGRPVNGTHYTPTEVEMLLYPSDQLVYIINHTRRESEYIKKMAQLTKENPLSSGLPSDDISAKDVESALRNMYDYSYLGDTKLADLNLVRDRLLKGSVTHLDKGKSVQSVLIEAIDKLCPETEPISDPPGREWYPYIIMHEAYLEDKPNRDIMAKLYISEGTFNRTRRAAIRSVTRVLEEMEAALH